MSSIQVIRITGMVCAPLPQLHQYRGAPYFENVEGSFVCNLCRTGHMLSLIVVRSHMHGQRHAKRYKTFLQREKENRVVKNWRASLPLRPRIQGLGLERWRSHVSQLLFAYLGPGSETDFVNAKMFLVKYELMEKLSLLDLAIWKQNILGNTFVTVQEARDYWVLEDGFDTQEFFFQRRMTSGVAVILPIVESFLGHCNID